MFCFSLGDDMHMGTIAVGRRLGDSLFEARYSAQVKREAKRFKVLHLCLVRQCQQRPPAHQLSIDDRIDFNSGDSVRIPTPLFRKECSGTSVDLAARVCRQLHPRLSFMVDQSLHAIFARCVCCILRTTTGLRKSQAAYTVVHHH